VIHLPASVRVYLCTSPCDMRRSFDGLHALVTGAMKLDAFGGHRFVFANRRKDRVKILYWDRDGFAVVGQAAEEGTYAMPFGEGQEHRREITAQELGALLSGIDRSVAERCQAPQTIPAQEHRGRINIGVRCILCLAGGRVRLIIPIVPVDPNSLPHAPAILKQMLVDLTKQLDKTQRLLGQWLAAMSGTRSEQLSADQLRLFAQELSAGLPTAASEAEADSQDDDLSPPPDGSGNRKEEEGRPRGWRPLPPHLKRERIEHDLTEEEKHCAACPGLAPDRRGDKGTLRVHSRAVAGDRGHLPEVRVRVHGEDGEQTAATHREEPGRRVFIGASDRQQSG
jgi:transposase